jgi:hypothetical protein
MVQVELVVLVVPALMVVLEAQDKAHISLAQCMLTRYMEPLDRYVMHFHTAPVAEKAALGLHHAIALVCPQSAVQCRHSGRSFCQAAMHREHTCRTDIPLETVGKQH